MIQPLIIRPTATLAALLIAATATAGAQRPRDSVSAPIGNVAYEVTFTRAHGDRGVVGVRMSFTTDGSGPVLLSVPTWTPGAYEISNFARKVIGFEAAAGGAPARWDKLDADTWRVPVSGRGAVEVSFTVVADSLDTAMAWARPDFLLFTGTTMLPYPEGQPLDFPSRLTITTERDWRIATGLRPAGEPRSYTAASYHELVDMPTFVGAFDLDSARVADRWMRFATYPVGAVAGAARATAWQQLAAVVPPQVAVFGSVPWEDYTVLQIVDSTFGGASGLEHGNSHVDIFSPQYLGSDFQPSLYAHEIFHAWNVKRLRPAAMWPYAYDRPQPTTLLWVSEGITDYYADLSMVRGGLVDAAGFRALLAAKMNEVRALPPTALEDASLSSWIAPLDGTHYLYYAKGALAGLLLDILVRDATDNARSLDTVMRALYDSTARQGRGFTAADFWGAVRREAGGRSFDDFAARYVDGRDEYPWDTVLPLAGLVLRQTRAPRLGVYTQMAEGGIVITELEPDGSAARAGVRPGDYLVSVGEIAVNDPTFGARFRARFETMAEGTLIPLAVRRGSEAIVLQAPLRFAPGDVVLEEDPRAGEKARRIRAGLLGK